MTKERPQGKNRCELSLRCEHPLVQYPVLDGHAAAADLFCARARRQRRLAGALARSDQRWYDRGQPTVAAGDRPAHDLYRRVCDTLLGPRPRSLAQRAPRQRIWQPITLTPDGSVRAMFPKELLHRLLTYDVLPRAGVIGAGTGNIICCAGATPKGVTAARRLH
jgi:hypothetical protein